MLAEVAAVAGGSGLDPGMSHSLCIDSCACFRLLVTLM